MERAYFGRRHRSPRTFILCVAFVVILIPVATLYHVFSDRTAVVHEREHREASQTNTATSTGIRQPSTSPSVAVRHTTQPSAVGERVGMMVFNEADKEMLAHLDSLDPLPPRDGEGPISFMQFIDCLAQRLRVDRHTKTEMPIRDTEPFIPYLVLPVTFEVRDVKQFVCNLTVPIKHLMYVQNGPIYSMSEFLDATAAIFAFTPRLQVRHYPKNVGYAGALNVALRDALTYPFEEVPFFFMSNNDVRFHASTLTEALPKMLSASMAGASLLKQFIAEVATEPNEYTPEVFRAVPLRSYDGEHVLVTSRYLPDRVRYMGSAERAKIFRGYAGVLYPDGNQQTAVWGLSRLAIETVGFFDENCFPAYYEDTEYLTRTQLFGFDVLYSSYKRDGTIHLNNNFLVTERAHAGASGLGDVLVFLRGLTEVIRHMLPGQYVGIKSTIVDLRRFSIQGQSMRQLLPPDAYVLNERRRRALEEMIELSLQYYRDGAADARLKQPEAIIAFVETSKRQKLLAETNPNMDAIAYYRNGYALRRLSLPMK